MIYPIEHKQFLELYNSNDFSAIILYKHTHKTHVWASRKGAKHSITEYDLSIWWSAMGFDANDKNLYTTASDFLMFILQSSQQGNKEFCYYPGAVLIVHEGNTSPLKPKSQLSLLKHFHLEWFLSIFHFNVS